VFDKAARTPFRREKRVGAYLMARAQEHGLITRALGDRIGFSPPLVMTPDETADMFDRFGSALAETETWLREGGWKPAEDAAN